MHIIEPSQWLQYLYPSLTWHKSRKQKEVYLTFDDGPVPIATPFVLQTLAQFNVEATFFCVGDNIAKHPGIYHQIKNAGHSIGNHTYNHVNGWTADDDTYLENIDQCATLVSSNLFRPPYGKIKRSQLKKLKISHPQLEVIMWDVLSYDHNPKMSVERCFNHLIKNVKNGSIIVFHDSAKAFDRLQYLLPMVLRHLLDEGYALKSLR